MQRIELDDESWVMYYPRFLSDEQAALMFEELKPCVEEVEATGELEGKEEEEEGEERVERFLNSDGTIEWRHDFVTLASGFVAREPRLTTFLGEREGLHYIYSSRENVSYPWPESVQRVKESIELVVGHPLNVCLANMYRTGLDNIGWHADNEADLSPGASIACLSLGTSREFQLRHIRDSEIGTRFSFVFCVFFCLHFFVLFAQPNGAAQEDQGGDCRPR